MARMIDADELIEFPYSESAGTEEQIEDWIQECGIYDEEAVDKAKKLCWKVIEGFVNVIKTAHTITRPTGWISVEDRLPKTGTVLATDGRVVITAPASSVTADGTAITHWMPWPEPPGKEKIK